jgi:hypothetical protein
VKSKEASPFFIFVGSSVFRNAFWALLFFSATLQHAKAQNQPNPSIEERLTKIEAQLSQQQTDTTAEDEELTKLKLELQLPPQLGSLFTGLGPAISRVYTSKRPLSIGAYGEFSYSAIQGGERITNVTRFNPVVGFRFSNTLIFNSALSFQNGGAVEGEGAARVEFAYLDFLLGPETGIRVGNILVPFGLTNLRPEPLLFPMVQRPRAEMRIVPTTWHENGVLGFGKLGNVLIQGGVLNSTDATRYDANSWIRSGRQNGANARADDSAFVLRVENLGDETSVGGSFYVGNSAQGAAALGRAQVLLGSLHGEFRADRFSGRAMIVEGRLSDTDKIAAVTNQPVGAKVQGGYALLSYDLLPRISPFARSLVNSPPPPGWRELPIFVSYEHENLQTEPTVGRSRIETAEHKTWTFGANYKPHPQVVFKGDFAYRTLGETETERVVELGLGFVF